MGSNRIRKKAEARKTRRRRVRQRVTGTQQHPRLCVFKSLRYTYVQLIADDTGSVVASASTRGVKVGERSERSVESAKALGLKIAELAKGKAISKVVFDRNGYRYHGRVAAVATGAREGGLEF